MLHGPARGVPKGVMVQHVAFELSHLYLIQQCFCEIQFSSIGLVPSTVNFMISANNDISELRSRCSSVS